MRKFLSLGVTVPVLFVTSVASASAQITSKIQGGLTTAAKGSGYTSGAAGSGDLAAIVGNLIGQALTLVGVLLLGLMLYGGILWMTAGGDKGKVEKATSVIKNAVIGLIVIVLAYALSNFIVLSLGNATTGGTGTGGTGQTPNP